MYKVGEFVIYGVHGVCRIMQMEIKHTDQSDVEYYVLAPVEQPDSRFYIPTGNPVAVAKLCPVLKREELDGIFSDLDSADGWINDENKRKLLYRQLIAGTDRAALLSMVRTVYLHGTELLETGKKLHICDENFLRDGERLLRGEFAVVLGMPPADAWVYILEKLTNK